MPPPDHYSITYTAQDRRLAISQTSQLSAWVRVLQTLEAMLALGLVVELSVRGLSAKADTGFLLIGMLVCAALLLYERRNTHWIEPGLTLEVELNPEALITQAQGGGRIWQPWPNLSLVETSDGLLLKARAQGLKQHLWGGTHLWLPARLFPTEAARQQVVQFLRERTGLVIAEPTLAAAAVRPPEALSNPSTENTGVYGRYLPEGPRREPRRFASVATRIGIYFLVYSLLHGVQLSNPGAADYNRGLKFLNGTPPANRDEVRAFIYFSQSAKAGQPEASNMLGILYQEGRGVPQNERTALVFFQEAAIKGSRHAQMNLARAYELGLGTPQDQTRAVLWYRKAAEGGYAAAEDHLGRHYRAGQGVARDDYRATDWFRRAAAQGNAPGQKDLADQYLEGRGVAQDKAQAALWYGKAAAQNNAPAQLALAKLYDAGEGVGRDPAKALSLYQQSAELGNAQAAQILGSRYATGEGVPLDPKLAFTWTRTAAEGGNLRAEARVGRYYVEGFGTPKDVGMGELWLERAAAQHEADGALALGELYRDGRGVMRNLPVAREWFARAAADGSVQAREALQTGADRSDSHERAVGQRAPVTTAHEVHRSNHPRPPQSAPVVAENPFRAIALAFVGYDCTADAIDSLRDQIACVDARITASPARMEFDDLAQRILAEVDNGSTNETDARKEIYATLAQRAVPSQP